MEYSYFSCVTRSIDEDGTVPFLYIQTILFQSIFAIQSSIHSPVDGYDISAINTSISFKVSSEKTCIDASCGNIKVWKEKNDAFFIGS